MRDTTLLIYQMVERSYDMEEGDEQISLLEDAVRLADIEGDLEAQYYSRERLIHACVFGGATEKALVAFSWCLAVFDQNPGMFSEWAILWKYKWIVGLIYDFPQVSKQKIYEMLDDLAERSRRAGYGLRAAYNQRYRAEKFWDNREEAVKYFQKMEETPPDGLSNCQACETDDYVSFSIYRGQYEKALELARPIISGSQKCSSVPHRTYANLLLPLVRLGRHNEALLYHRRGYRLIAGNRTYLDRAADHLMFLSLTENFTQASSLFEKHYIWTEENKDAYSQFHFYRASWLFFEMLAEAGREDLQLTLPRSFPLRSEDGRYQRSQLSDWFRAKADGLARRFDARNETDRFARMMASTPALKELAASAPMLETEW